MKNFKFLILNFAFIFFIVSCASKTKEIKKEETPPAPPVKVAQVSPPPPEIKPAEKPSPPAPIPAPAPVPVPAPPPEKKENFILLNFDEADLKDIISLVSEAIGVNFIIAPGTSGRITIHSTKKIPSTELFPIFQSILEMNGLAAVKSGEFYKIVPGPAARQKALEIYKGRDLATIPTEDKLLTQLVPVEFIPVSEAVTLLQPMVSPIGVITPNTRNNLLIITDVASNIRRLIEILMEVDVSAFEGTRIRLFTPQNVDVKTLHKELTDILTALALGKEGISFIPLERLNKLIIFSPSEKFLQTVEEWAKKLDEEVAPRGITAFVYPIQNVKAKEIAEVLKTIYETKEGVRPVTPTPTPTPTPITRPPTPTPTPRPTTPTPTPMPTIEGRPVGEIKIVVYEPTNSLVILASPADYKQIVETIKKLDVYPQQVLIETLIAEVALDETTQFGIQWKILSQDKVKLWGETHTFEGTTALNIGEGIGLSTSGLSYLLYEAGRVTAAIHALATEGKVNVLSSPHIVVRDNEEAKINIGTEEPIATRFTQVTIGTTQQTLPEIQYRTTGVILTVKPQINEMKAVVLDITQEVSEVGPAREIAGAGKFPSFTKREAKTTITAEDKQTIVIGGLIREIKSKDYEGIPILSDIPLLGYLFRYTTDIIKKTELIILMTPHVVTSKDEADLITQEFKEKVKTLKKPLRKIEKEQENREREEREREEKEKRPEEEYLIPG
jgi:general secretion pathway protein D